MKMHMVSARCLYTCCKLEKVLNLDVKTLSLAMGYILNNNVSLFCVFPPRHYLSAVPVCFPTSSYAQKVDTFSRK